MQRFLIIILISTFVCLIHVSNPRVHLQEEGFMYTGMV